MTAGANLSLAHHSSGIIEEIPASPKKGASDSQCKTVKGLQEVTLEKNEAG